VGRRDVRPHRGAADRWGAEVARWLELADDARVLDAGCGSGRVTEMVLERAPGITVVALDASTEMIARPASARLENSASWSRTQWNVAVERTASTGTSTGSGRARSATT
jgi:trans-aconitate 2-methyltransferase